MLIKKVDFGKIAKRLTESATKKLRLEAQNIEVGIVNRTLKGKDVNLRAFKPYSTSYKQARVEKGRGSQVNLADTGQMLGAITHKKIPNGLRFYFSAKSEADKAIWNQKTRYFFGIDKNQKKYLTKQLAKL